MTLLVEYEDERSLNLGELKPIHGRWSWPLGWMKPGEFFYVDHARRNPEEVRQYVGVRAAQLSKRFSVMANDPDRPGYARVTCVPLDAKKAEPIMSKLDYEKAGIKLSQWYGFPIHHIQAGDLWGKGRTVNEVKQVEKPPVKYLVFPFPPFDQVGAIMDEDGIEFQVVPEGMSAENWAAAAELAQIMA